MRTRVVAVIGLLSLPAGAHAQMLAGISSTLIGSPAAPAGWRASSQIAPLLRLDLPSASLEMQSAFDGVGSTLQPRSASFASRAGLPLYGPLRFAISGAIDRDWTTAGVRRADSASIAVSYRRGTAGTWLGGGAASATSPALLAGVWKQIDSRASLSISSAVRGSLVGRPPGVGGFPLDSVVPDTIGVGYPPAGTAASGRPRLRTWTETEAHVGLSFGPVALDAALGWRPAADSVRSGDWMNAIATVRVSPLLALIVGGGTRPSSAGSSGSNTPFARLGVRFAPIQALRPAPPPAMRPTAGAFAVRPRGAGEYVVQIRVPAARSVELSGDFDGWQPVRLSEVQPDVWEVVVSLAPGTYRMNLRVDGESWIAPPGTPAVDDDFNGRVGLVVVR